VKHGIGIFESFPQLADSPLGWQKQQLHPEKDLPPQGVCLFP